VEQGATLGMTIGSAAGAEPRASLSALWRATRDPGVPATPRVHLHSRLAHPLAHLALLLAGLPLVLRRESRSLVVGALLAGAVCGAYFLLQIACFDLGVRGWIPPALAGWAPVAILAAFGLALFDTLPT
jgi:lipopolysaccharide export LptBFGC system permease protein LptF